MNQSNYFPHHCDARNDDKILRARCALGSAEGYAIPFMLYERLCAKEGHKEEADYQSLAFDLRVDKESIQRVIEEFGLFQTELGEDGKTYFYFSEGLSERLAPMDERRKKRREAGQKGGNVRVSRSKNTSLLEKNPSKSDVLLEEKSSKSANLLEKNSSRVEESKKRKTTTTNKLLSLSKESAVCHGTNNPTTTNFEEKNNWSAKLTDKEYLDMAQELLTRFAAAPSQEIDGIVDLCHPEWNGQYGNFINNKADVIGKLWKIPDERKYRRSHGANKLEREAAAAWIDVIRIAEVYDPFLIDCYRGLRFKVNDAEDDTMHLTLFVRSNRDIEILEEVHLIPLFAAMRTKFGNKIKLMYAIQTH